jgi:hypothetical protein
MKPSFGCAGRVNSNEDAIRIPSGRQDEPSLLLKTKGLLAMHAGIPSARQQCANVCDKTASRRQVARGHFVMFRVEHYGAWPRALSPS